MSSNELSSIAGVVLSLLFSYVPKLNTWYAALDEAAKRLIMLVSLLVVAGVSFGLACLPATAGQVPQITCDSAGAWGLVKAFIAALVANQSAYMITLKTRSVKQAWVQG